MYHHNIHYHHGASVLLNLGRSRDVISCTMSGIVDLGKFFVGFTDLPFDPLTLAYKLALRKYTDSDDVEIHRIIISLHRF